jgi:tRNA-specific 2-thiouridylase
MGKKVGEHTGVQFYTVGQRRGLGVGGTGLPLFILEKEVSGNILYVGRGEEHLGLSRRGLRIENEDIHWIREDLKLKNGGEMKAWVRIRYRQPLEKATLYKKEDGLYIIFENSISSIASGQFAAWYIEDELIGSGVIY